MTTLREQTEEAYRAALGHRQNALRTARSVFHMEISLANANFWRVLSVTTEQAALDEANRVQHEAIQAANTALDVAENNALREERAAIQEILRKMDTDG
jgi:hypothetical protein